MNTARTSIACITSITFLARHTETSRQILEYKYGILETHANLSYLIVWWLMRVRNGTSAVRRRRYEHVCSKRISVFWWRIPLNHHRSLWAQTWTPFWKIIIRYISHWKYQVIITMFLLFSSSVFFPLFDAASDDHQLDDNKEYWTKHYCYNNYSRNSIFFFSFVESCNTWDHPLQNQLYLIKLVSL